MSDAVIEQAVFCGECGCLVEGAACAVHPQAILTSDEQVYIVPGVPILDEADDVITQACKRLVYLRCVLNQESAWSHDNNLPALATLLDRHLSEVFGVIETINPELAHLLTNVDGQKLVS